MTITALLIRRIRIRVMVNWLLFVTKRGRLIKFINIFDQIVYERTLQIVSGRYLCLLNGRVWRKAPNRITITPKKLQKNYSDFLWHKFARRKTSSVIALWNG